MIIILSVKKSFALHSTENDARDKNVLNVFFIERNRKILFHLFPRRIIIEKLNVFNQSINSTIHIYY